MPVYNSEKYLSMALESLLNQTLKDIEIICIDDGSTDNSMQILEDFQKKDNRIIILSQNHLYAGVARNYGMSVASGKYLSFLDADDYFVPQMLEKAYVNAEEEKADIVIFNGEYFVDNLESAYMSTGFLKESLMPNSNGFDNRNKIQNILNITNPAPWNKIFSAEFIRKNKIKFQSCKRGNDLFFIEIALALSERIGIVRENLIYYRTKNEVSLQGTIKESPDYFINILLDIRLELKKRKIFNKVEKSFRNLCLDNCLYNLSNTLDAFAFEQLYTIIKEYAFKEFNIYNSLESDYYNSYAYQEYIYIANHTSLEFCMKRIREISERNTIKNYLFPFDKVEKNSRIVLYGGGNVGRAFYSQIRKSKYCILEVWVDKKVREYDSFSLVSLEQVKWDNIDYVIIALENKYIADDVSKIIHKTYSVSLEKILYENPVV